MGQQINKLSSRAAATLIEPGRHSDGNGLYLNITASGAKSWVYLYNVAGRRREMGLGSFRDVPLVQARARAQAVRQKIAAGVDPLAVRSDASAITFGEAVNAFFASKGTAWRNAKHRAQWEMTLHVYAAGLTKLSVAAITTDDVLRVLNPIWRTKAETASRLRGRIERVLDFAKARGWRTGENPARWRGHFDAILPKRQKLTRGHHKALPFAEVPEFMAKLRVSSCISNRALEFTILTAARSGEVLNARWAEIDLQARLWTVPASRMKAQREHRVPLSERACAILAEMSELQASEFVFPGMKADMPLSEMALLMALRRTGVNATVHGFRSTFRDWVGEATDYPREIAEAALAHLVGNAVERAYRRGDALAKRRALMAAWAAYCNDGSEARVVPFPTVAHGSR